MFDYGIAFKKSNFLKNYSKGLISLSTFAPKMGCLIQLRNRMESPLFDDECNAGHHNDLHFGKAFSGLGKQTFEVAAEDGLGLFFARADFDERLDLRIEHIGSPTARKERRVGAEQQSFMPDNMQGLLEDGRQIRWRCFVIHPLVAA